MADKELQKLIEDAETAKGQVERLEAELVEARTEQRKTATALSAALTHLTGAAGSATRRTTGSIRSKSDLPLTAIREWASKHGHKVSDRGRVAEPVIKAWEEAGKPGA